MNIPMTESKLGEYGEEIMTLNIFWSTKQNNPIPHDYMTSLEIFLHEESGVNNHCDLYSFI